MKKEIIMFDFDNTIVNSLKYWYRSIDKEIYRKHGLKIDKTMSKKRRLCKTNKEVASIFSEYANISNCEALQEWYDLMEYYYLHKVKLIKGVREYLLQLRHTHKLVIASATDRPLLKKALAHFEIDFFDEILTQEELGLSKSHPDFFKKSLKILQTDKDKVLLFEDSLASIQSALSNGIDCCAVVHKYNKNHKKELQNLCKLTIKDFTDKNLKNLIY